jgi:hypothetical protein
MFQSQLKSVEVKCELCQWTYIYYEDESPHRSAEFRAQRGILSHMTYRHKKNEKGT